MALQEQNIPISFAKGVNTKTDPKQVMAGQLLSLSNGVFTKINAINEDPGYLPLPQAIYNSAQSTSIGNSITTFDGNLIKTDGLFLYNFSETNQNWIQVPTKIANSITSDAIATNALGSSAIGLASNAAGLEFYTYYQLSNNLGSDAGQINIQSTNLVIYDPESETILYNSQIANPVNASSTVRPYSIFATSSGTTFSTIWLDSNININYTTIDSINPVAAPSSNLLISSIGPDQPMPDVVSNANGIYILYADATNLRLARYSSSFTLITSVLVVNTGSVATPLDSYSLSVDEATGNLYVLYSTFGSGTVALTAYSSTLSVIRATVTISGITGPGVYGSASLFVSTNLLYVYAQKLSPSSLRFQYYDTILYAVNITAGTAGAAIENLFGCYIATKPYIYNNQPTINVGFYDFNIPRIAALALLVQSVYFTVQQTIPNTNYSLKTPYTIITKYAEGTAGAPLSVSLFPAPPNTVLRKSATSVVIPYLYAVNVTINSNVNFNSYNVGRLNTILGTKTISVELGNNLNLTGGVVSMYDQVGIAESGYHIFPWQTIATFSLQPVVGTPPPSLTAGTYSYVVTYEWTDNIGNLHRSAPGPASTGVASAPTSSLVSQAVITVSGTALSEQYKLYNIQVVLWRTTANGSIFYRVRSQPNAVGVITFQDQLPDDLLIGATQLYTTGGEVENIAPPASDIIFPFKNRVIAVQADNPYVWWASKQVIQGFPVEFTDVFAFNIDMTGGPISAGYTMDDKLIFFKDSTIFYVIGDGPAPNGTQNDFSYPQVITSDVGCRNQDSIIVVPIGLMFQSTDKGIYLLDRALQLSYIGAPVEAFNNVRVTSAELLPNTTQIRFTLESDTTLIYDYLVQQWSTHSGLTFVDATTYKHMHTGLQADALVLEQTPVQWVDNSTPVALSLTTGWFSFAQLQGYQRIIEFLLLLTSTNATSLKIQLYINFDSTTAIQTDTISIPANTVRQQYRIFPSTQKCQSMQIVITEIPTGASGGGLTLSGMSFIMGIKRGLNKVSSDRNYG